MECEQMEKVSPLIDGELSDEEATALSAHVANCRLCEGAYADFMSLRREIRSFEVKLEPFVQERVLGNFAAARNPALWRRRIAIPVPVLAVFFVALFAVALWSTVRLSRTRTSQAVKVRRITTEGESQSAFDLSRFDHGDRAAIVKIKQGSSAANQ